jgi:hypothetical protein
MHYSFLPSGSQRKSFGTFKLQSKLELNSFPRTFNASTGEASGEKEMADAGLCSSGRTDVEAKPNWCFTLHGSAFQLMAVKYKVHRSITSNRHNLPHQRREGTSWGASSI